MDLEGGWAFASAYSLACGLCTATPFGVSRVCGVIKLWKQIIALKYLDALQRSEGGALDNLIAALVPLTVQVDAQQC